MATLHVLCGLPGSGKSTFAQRLVRDRLAIRLSNDDWMRELFGRNPPEEQFREVFTKIEGLQWRLAADLLRRGVDVVWDYGVWTVSARADLKRRCVETGAEFVLYAIICDFETAARRVLERSSVDDGHLVINRAALEVFREQFEVPTDKEGFQIEKIQSQPVGRRRHRGAGNA